MISILNFGKLIFEHPLNYCSQLSYKRCFQFSNINHADSLKVKARIVSQYRHYLSDLGNVVDYTSLTDKCSDDSPQQHYSVSIQFDKNTIFYVCISLSRSNLLRINERLNGGLLNRHDDSHENFAQLVYNINYSVCRSARHQEYKLKHGAVQSHLPNDDQPVLTHCYIL